MNLAYRPILAHWSKLARRTMLACRTMLARRTLLALCAAACAGCVHYAPLAGAYGGPEELPDSIASRYAYPSRALTPESSAVKERRDFVVRDVQLAPAAAGAAAAADGARGAPATTIKFEYYDVGGDEPAPVVLLLPILNGNVRVTRYFAHYFAEQGYAALVMDRDREPIPLALQHVEQTLHRNLLDYRRVLDWITTNPRLDSSKIGVFGISFGGIDAIMLAALDDRVQAVVAGMAGGDLPYLFVNTSYRSVARQVAREMRQTGLSRDALEARLDGQLETDPMELAPYVNAEDVLLVMTRSDWIIPFEAQEALRLKLGEPETLVLPTGHRTSVVYFPLVRSSAYDFFARRFEEIDAERSVPRVSAGNSPSRVAADASAARVAGDASPPPARSSAAAPAAESSVAAASGVKSIPPR
ncbi:MAG TPA: CocE/NonD family hydrolase [Gammaproteobacteria bacterium]|nr:CocE/NonD family hydrolase [Gammaproteobacteria bacterium]